MSAEDRLMELEIRIAYQDRTIATLDEVVRDTTRRLGRLEAELQSMRRTMESSDHSLGAADTVPPHY